MTWNEVLDHARSSILNCKACPECNGLACGNTLPGPGSKAPGNGANDNWRAWKRLKLNFDTFVPDGPVDTTLQLFGREYTLPLLTGPIGSMTQYSKTDVTVAFNDGVMQGTAETGTIDYFGDGAEGVKTYIEMLRSELSGAMYMVGARKLSDLNPDMVR